MATLAREIAEFFRVRQGKIISHEEVYETIWDIPTCPGYKNTLQATMSNARKLLPKGNIYSVQGIGYIYLEAVNENSN